MQRTPTQSPGRHLGSARIPHEGEHALGAFSWKEDPAGERGCPETWRSAEKRRAKTCTWRNGREPIHGAGPWGGHGPRRRRAPSSVGPGDSPARMGASGEGPLARTGTHLCDGAVAGPHTHVVLGGGLAEAFGGDRGSWESHSANRASHKAWESQSKRGSPFRGWTGMGGAQWGWAGPACSQADLVLCPSGGKLLRLRLCCPCCLAKVS